MKHNTTTCQTTLYEFLLCIVSPILNYVFDVHMPTTSSCNPARVKQGQSELSAIVVKRYQLYPETAVYSDLYESHHTKKDSEEL